MVLEAAAGQALLALRQQRMATEAVAAQRRAETTELRGTLLSAAGDDLRTPLTSIRAAVSHLCEPGPRLSEQDTNVQLAIAKKSTDRLTRVVDDLLDCSRLASGALEPRMTAVRYHEVVARALSTLDVNEPISLDVDERLPSVRADASLLARVVASVVDNAVRHGTLVPRRPVDVDGDGVVTPDEPFMAIRASSYTGRVELRIVDHGPGLPKGTAESIFAHRPGDQNGTPRAGLGLSVVKGFTESMGGTIRAEDTPGGGLTVVISLPAHRES
jgi:two-component system sensor histidine kinase KdpD